MKHTAVILAFAFSIPFLGCIETSVESTADVSVDAAERNIAPEVNSPTAEAPSDQTSSIVFGDKFPEVLAVEATPGDHGNWRFSVKLSSAYDTPQRYADAWHVLDDEDHELGIRILGHAHANEQPFTRSGSIKIPEDTSVVYVEGRDKENGWSGQRFEFKMPSN